MLRMIGAAAAVMLITGPTDHPRRSFSDDMIRRFRIAVPRSTVTRDPADAFVIHISSAGAKPMTANVHRIYNICRHAGTTECANAKAEYVSAILTPVPEATLGTLRIIVRDAEYVSQIGTTGDTDKLPTALTKSIGEDLNIVLASVTPGAVMLVGAVTLKELAITPAAAWVLAWRQTRTELPRLPTAGQLRGGPVIYQEQSNVASLLAYRAGWSRLAKIVGPDLLMTVVSDDYVLVGVKSDGPELDRFRKTVAEDCDQLDRCISPHIYRFREGQWRIAR